MKRANSIMCSLVATASNLSTKQVNYYYQLIIINKLIITSRLIDISLPNKISTIIPTDKKFIIKEAR